jgi:hypothetical protein
MLVLALLLLPIDVAIRRLRISRDELRSGLSAAMHWVSSFLPWLRPAILETDASGAAAVGLAQLKSSRSRIRLRPSLKQEEAIQRAAKPNRLALPRASPFARVTGSRKRHRLKRRETKPKTTRLCQAVCSKPAGRSVTKSA